MEAYYLEECVIVREEEEAETETEIEDKLNIPYLERVDGV